MKRRCGCRASWRWPGTTWTAEGLVRPGGCWIPWTRTISSVPDLEQAFATLRRREQAVKTRAAEAALREARRVHRREPVRAIELLESTELDGLPDELARHL